MRAAVLLVTTAFALTLGSSVAAKEGRPGFPLGVAAGDLTPTSVRVWARAPKPGPVTIMLLSPGAGTRANPVRVYTVRASVESDLTVQRVLTGLRPATAYRYRFWQADVSSRLGTFRTPPRRTSARTVRFAFTGDADATPGPNGRPGFNGFETYGAMARERNDFNVNFGDTIYSDSELAGAEVARTVEQKRAKYKLALALEPLRRLRASAALYSGWDDHEFVNDFSRAEDGAEIYDVGRQAFLEYAPATYRPATGLYRSFRWGRHLEVFFLDGRSFRSAKVNTTCGGDLAPTAPTAARQAFAALAPSLARPVSQTCLDAIASPERTLLGAAQLGAFTRAIRASTATFKVVVNPVPMMQLFVLPYDRWEGYAAERARVLQVLQEVKNVVVLTTDTHAHLIGEIRTRTFGGSGPVGTGIFEVIAGPVATNTYAREIDDFLGSPGSGAVVSGAFFKPQPPSGLGLRCAQTDAYGYAQVTVTGTILRVVPRTAAGTPVLDVTGVPCAPLVVRAT